MASYVSFATSSLLVGTLRLPRLDVLITESPPLVLGPSGLILSRLKRARRVFNVSGLWPETAVALGAVRDGLLLRLAYKLEALCYRQAWRVSCQSRGIQDGVNRRFPNVRTVSFLNGVNTERFSPVFRSESVWADLGVGSGPIAVYAGLHGVGQGLDQVLGAAETKSCDSCWSATAQKSRCWSMRRVGEACET
jgi:hypothetical protein